MSGYGPIHTLIVTDVGEPYGPFDTGEFVEYELQHPGCKHEDADMGGYTWEVWHCGVGHEQREGCLRWSLHYTGTPITEPGSYKIQAWAETIRGFDYVEYDGGVAVITDG